MKTHNYGPNLALLLAAACSLAACTDSTPVTTATAQATATTPTATTPTTTAARAIGSGKYHVCAVSDDADKHKHTPMTGVHIKLGAEVDIKTIQTRTATLVCLGGTCPTDPMDPTVSEKVLWMVGDANTMGTVHAFAHEDKTTHAPIKPIPQHLVQLTSETEIPDGCNPHKNVLMLRFCEWGKDARGNPAWLCAGDAPHAGAVHLEP